MSFCVRGASCFELQLRDLSCSLALLAYSTKIEDNKQVACGNKLQIKFLNAHSFFTETSTRLREVNKQNQIERIESLIVD